MRWRARGAHRQTAAAVAPAVVVAAGHAVRAADALLGQHARTMARKNGACERLRPNSQAVSGVAWGCAPPDGRDSPDRIYRHIALQRAVATPSLQLELCRQHANLAGIDKKYLTKRFTSKFRSWDLWVFLTCSKYGPSTLPLRQCELLSQNSSGILCRLRCTLTRVLLAPPDGALSRATTCNVAAGPASSRLPRRSRGVVQ